MTAAGRGRGAAAPRTRRTGLRSERRRRGGSGRDRRRHQSAGGYTRDVPLRLQMAAGWKPADSASAALWVVGEIGGVADLGPQWSEGFDATATLTTPADVTVATGRLTSPRGAHVPRRADAIAAARRRRLHPARRRARRSGVHSVARGAAFAIPESPGAAGALFVRRGPSTANKEVPTADLRFRRSESIRLEIPTTAGAAGAARLPRSHREAARGPRRRRRARRCRRVAVAHRAARARAAGAGRLRDRDRERGPADAVGFQNRPLEDIADRRNCRFIEDWGKSTCKSAICNLRSDRSTSRRVQT